MSFGVVQCRQAGDKEGKVRGVVVLHTEVVHHQDKSYRTRGMTEKTRSEGLMEVKGGKERDKTEIGQLTGLFEAVHRFVDAKQDKLFACFILLEEWEEREARQDFGGEKVSVDFDELGLGEGRLKVKVSQVDGSEEGVRRDNRVKQDVDAGKRGDKDGRGDRRLETVAAGGASHPPVDVRFVGAVRAG